MAEDDNHEGAKSYQVSKLRLKFFYIGSTLILACLLQLIWNHLYIAIFSTVVLLSKRYHPSFIKNMVQIQHLPYRIQANLKVERKGLTRFLARFVKSKNIRNNGIKNPRHLIPHLTRYQERMWILHHRKSPINDTALDMDIPFKEKAVKALIKTVHYIPQDNPAFIQTWVIRKDCEWDIRLISQSTQKNT